MRFPQSARSRGPNPEPASLIAPVVSSSACCSRELNPKRGDEPYAFRARALFNRERFSTAHAPRTRETLSRLSNQPRPLTVERVRRRGFFRFVSSRARSLARSEKTPRGAVASRASRARLHTRGRARRRTSATRRFPPDVLRLDFSQTCPPKNRSRPSPPVVAETPRGPRGGSRLGRGSRPPAPRARS